MNIDKLEGSFKVVGVITVPRVGFSETFSNINMTIQNCKIPVVGLQGPYWNQGISNGIVQALTHNPKYILTYDGDSVFQPSDIEKLMKIMDDNDHIDALCPVQADRNADVPLAYAWNNQTLGPFDFSGELTEIAHGHFGCTFMRADIFRKMERPWFIGVPNVDGTWSGMKRDDDTEFWRKFNKAGLHLYQANDVVIGHMELMVRWQHGPNVLVQTLADFHTNGKPQGLRNPTVEEIQQKLQPHQFPPMPRPTHQPVMIQQNVKVEGPQDG